MKHHFLTPLQNAAPHVQSKQHLKLLLKISESVDCLVCSDEDLRRTILTDFASINYLTVSIHIYINKSYKCMSQNKITARPREAQPLGVWANLVKNHLRYMDFEHQRIFSINIVRTLVNLNRKVVGYL